VRHGRRSNWSERQERVASTFEKSPRQLKPISRATFATKSANCCREQMQQGACTETEFIRAVGAGGLASVCPVTVVADISCEDCAIEHVPL
jgi:hypothetical protein